MDLLFGFCSRFVPNGEQIHSKGFPLVSTRGGCDLFVQWRASVVHCLWDSFQPASLSADFYNRKVLTGKDVILFGQAFLLLALPMTWLMTQQFQAEREDIMNIAAGGTGYQLETSGGKVRASGTFTFVSGPFSTFASPWLF